MPYPILTNVPIQEALIDFQVTFSGDINLELLLSVHPHIRDNFPKQEKKFKWTTGFQIKGEGAEISEHSGGQIGYMFKSDDNSKILQVSTEGFTFNKLPPYQSWELFCHEARALWEMFVNKTKPIKINRIGLRYINRIEIPSPIKGIGDYILTRPKLAPGIQNSITNSLMKVELALNNIGATAIITETFGNKIEQSLNNKLPLIFDIDVIKFVVLDPMDSKVWSYLGELREAKNRIFFKSLSDRSLELLK